MGLAAHHNRGLLPADPLEKVLDLRGRRCAVNFAGIAQGHARPTGFARSLKASLGVDAPKGGPRRPIGKGDGPCIAWAPKPDIVAVIGGRRTGGKKGEGGGAGHDLEHRSMMFAEFSVVNDKCQQ